MRYLRALARERIGTFRALFVVRLLQLPLRASTRPLIRRLPRDRALVVFGASSNRFADNPAYAFLACSDEASLRCVWISGSARTVAHVRALGLHAYRRWHPRGVWAALRAGWYVYGWSVADVNRWLGDGARTFNLWHGVGVKRIQRSRTVGEGAAVYAAPDRSIIGMAFADDRHRPDLVLSTSAAMTPVLAEAFGVAPQRCVELGYPRNDHLLAAGDPPAGLADPALLARLRGARVVGYFPTFRDDSLTIPGGAPLVAQIARRLASQDATLVFKAHDASRVGVEGAEGIVVLPPEADLNAYLGACDVLVTDYSSVASDFLLLGRPIVLFVPDLDDYDGARGFALDPTTHLPGTVTRTTSELYDALADLDALLPPANLGELREFYWGRRPAPAGSRLRELLAASAFAASAISSTRAAEAPPE